MTPIHSAAPREFMWSAPNRRDETTTPTHGRVRRATPEEHLLDDRPHDGQHRDDHPGRVDLDNGGDVRVVAQPVAAPGHHLAQPLRRQPTDRLEDDHEEETQDQCHERPPLVGQDLAALVRELGAPGERAHREEQDVNHHAQLVPSGDDVEVPPDHVTCVPHDEDSLEDAAEPVRGGVGGVRGL